MHNKQPYSFEKTDVRGRFLLNFSCTKVQSKDVSPIAGNGGDWRSKSLAPMFMVSTTLDGFYFANCVLAAVFFSLIFSTL